MIKLSLSITMPIDFRNLELFRRAAELGAIGKAGSQLGYSSSSASQCIKNLETDLGVKLFYRTTRSISLTADGKVILQYANSILGELAEMKSAFETDQKSLSGILRVTASASLARSHIVPFIPEFVKLHPNIDLDLNFTDNIVDVVKEGYDLAFRIGRLEASQMSTQKIDSNPYCIVASPNYLRNFNEPKIPSDLKNHDCMIASEGDVWSFLGKDNEQLDVTVSGPITTNFGDAVSEFVLAGMGIGMGSLWHVSPDIKAGRLVPLLCDYRVGVKTDIWAVLPPSRSMTRRVSAFLDFMSLKIKTLNRQSYNDFMNRK